RLSHKPGPGDVVIHGSRRIFFSPDIEQHEITLADWFRASCLRRVVRVAAVFVDSHYRKIVGDQILPAEGLDDPLLNFMLVGPAVPGSPADLLTSRGGDGIDRI